MAQVEIFTPDGVISGATPRLPLVGDGPTLEEPLPLERARWYPLDGSAPSHVGDTRVAPDDILVVVLPEPDILVHQTWYDLQLEIGPYRVQGKLGTPPGFDPDRAISRPGGSFVALRDAVITLRHRADAGAAERAHVQVNRYAVEGAASALMLGFYFPGAAFTVAASVPTA